MSLIEFARLAVCGYAVHNFSAVPVWFFPNGGGGEPAVNLELKVTVFGVHLCNPALCVRLRRIVYLEIADNDVLRAVKGECARGWVYHQRAAVPFDNEVACAAYQYASVKVAKVLPDAVNLSRREHNLCGAFLF